MKKSSSKSYYNLRPKFRLIPGSSQKKSATSQKNCRRLLRPVRPRRKRSNILWNLFTRKRRYHEHQQSTRRRNWDQEPLNTDQSESPFDFTSFEYTQWKSRHNSKTNRRENRHLKWIQSFKWYRRKRGIVIRRYPTYFRNKTPEKTIPKRERRKFRPPRIRRFIPDYSTDRSSSEENIADFDDEMDASTLQGLQQTIIELQ